MLAELIHSGCLMHVAVEHGRWCVYVVQSDGMSSSSSGASSISSTKKRVNSGVIGRLEAVSYTHLTLPTILLV